MAEPLARPGRPVTPRLHGSLLSLPADLPLPERLTRIARAGFGDEQIPLPSGSRKIVG
ncbi:hypothetical protein [Streptomyces sp. WAC01280]|uniref:hypothetical protein n=1 Tax=Streptomyces sp. WAC01280 TaxID=2487424 RepID=UPI00163D1632|nr:hypothetical protein [Streptomyces sp. WAC01280]